jgi:hypothetical protein
MKLVRLLLDYERDVDQIRDRFSRDPAGVFAAYDVPLADYEALLALPTSARQVLPAQVTEALRRMGDPVQPQLKWPGPTLGIVRIEPEVVRTGHHETLTMAILAAPAQEVDPGLEYSVSVRFSGTSPATGEPRVIWGAPILPIALPPSPVERVDIRCAVTFDEPGAHDVEVRVTKQNAGAPYTHVARYHGRLEVRAA